MERQLETASPGGSTVGPTPTGAADPLSFLATTGGALLLVLALRALYLVRFGHDPCWMNYNYLLEAKAMRFGLPAEFTGLPLVPALLLAAQEVGASAATALAAIYLAGHALLAVGTLGLAAHVLDGGGRSRALLAILLAVTPLLATDTGYRNASCTLAAGLLAALSALVLAPPTSGRGVRLLGAVALAAMAACCRTESLLGVAGLAAAVLLWGPRLGARRILAGALVAGLAAGLWVSSAWNARLEGPGRSPAAYAFYSFYTQSPLLLRVGWYLRDPGSVATEYARYATAARLLGGVAENGGSVARALARHPLVAAGWFAAKPVDLAVQTVLPDALTPLAIVALVLAWRRLRREGALPTARRWAPIAAAFALPGALLLAVCDHTHYLLAVAPVLALGVAWGLEPAVLRARAPALRRWGAGAVVAGAAAVAFAGHLGGSSNDVTGAAARWLAERCAGAGCLVNALPQSIDAQAWANLQAGAPLPPKVKRSEAFVFRRHGASYLDQVRIARRIDEARRSGWRGPVLWVRTDIRSIQVFDDDFDPEHRLEGALDLEGARRVVAFSRGADTVEVLELPGVQAGDVR